MSEEDLLTKLAEINEKLSSGEFLESTGSGEVNASQRLFRNLKRVQAEVLYDLHVIDPVRYPKYRRIDRVRARVC
jgi:hypothetical protein